MSKVSSLVPKLHKSWSHSYDTYFATVIFKNFLNSELLVDHACNYKIRALDKLQGN